MIAALKKRVLGNHSSFILRPLLDTLGAMGRLVPVRLWRQLIAEGQMFYAYKRNDLLKIEQVFLRLCQREVPDRRLVNFYITRLVGTGLTTCKDNVLNARYFPQEAIPLMSAAEYMLRDEPHNALLALKAPTSSFAYRLAYAMMERKIFHQNHDHRANALSGMAFLTKESDAVLLSFAPGVAAAAEACGDDAVFAFAVSRINADLDKVWNDTTLFKRHWKEAMDAALAVLDLERALLISQRAARIYKTAQTVLKRLNTVARDVSRYRTALTQAHQDILARAGLARRPAQPETPHMIVLLPAAALRFNSIDYEGFRSDLRFVLDEVFAFLEQQGVPYTVQGRMQRHGCIALEQPYFSYHTVSDTANGLHFKETDRPHSFSLDRLGYAGWSEFSHMPLERLDLDAVDATTAETFFREEQRTVFERKISKYRQFNAQDALPERYVFVPLQVMGDAVQSLAFVTPQAMLDAIIATCRPLGIAVVVKRHPLCASASLAHYLHRQEEAGYLVQAHGNIHDLIPRALAVCTVNSGVGAEALLYEKPVYVFGACDYSAACFVCAQPNDFQLQFCAGTMPVTPLQLYRFWWIFRNAYAHSTHDKDAFRAFLSPRLAALAKQVRA